MLVSNWHLIVSWRNGDPASVFPPHECITQPKRAPEEGDGHLWDDADVDDMSGQPS